MTGPGFDKLYKTYGPNVFRRACAILGDRDAAQDAMQEVFVRAHRLGILDKDESPMGWLYRVTTNYCLNQRRNRRRQGELLAMHHDAVQPGSPAPHADDRIAVLQIIDKVPEELAQIAYHYYFDGMNHDEIAEVVGVSRRTIGNRLDEFRRLALEDA